MKSEMTDHDLKNDLKNGYSVPSFISERVDRTLNALPPKKDMARSTVRFKKYRTKLIACSIAVVICLSFVISSPTIASNFLASQAYRNNAFVIFDGFYYVATGKEYDSSELGNQLLEVRRVGDWNIKKQGDSNHFTSFSPIYAIENRNSEQVIAVKVTLFNYFTTYIELARGDRVKQKDPDTILSAKNDQKETEMALNNISKQSFDLYALDNMGESIQLTLAHYDSEQGATLYYRVPEADIKKDDGTENQGFLFIYEYLKGNEPHTQSAFTPPLVVLKREGESVIKGPDPEFSPPEPSEQVIIGDIEWGYYGDQLVLGTKGNMYYEIQTQGNFTKELIFQLLKHFKEKNPNELKDLNVE